MAILRGREVNIVSVVHEQDPSTFQVRYPSGDNEIVKMHELGFTQAEYDQYIKPHQSEVKIVDDKEVKSVRDSQDPKGTPVKTAAPAAVNTKPAK